MTYDVEAVIPALANAETASPANVALPVSPHLRLARFKGSWVTISRDRLTKEGKGRRTIVLFDTFNEVTLEGKLQERL